MNRNHEPSLRKRGHLWLALRRIKGLRSIVYFIIELRRAIREPQICNTEAVMLEFKVGLWNYENNPTEMRRLQDQTALLDSACKGKHFKSGLEIGCADGLYTEVLADRCETLQVCDILSTALDRAKRRRQWSAQVQFVKFDLRLDRLNGSFDLIIVGHVLDYFSRPTTMYHIRKKLVLALKPGGYLLLTSPRVHPIVENAWWARHLIRGRWINEFMSRSPLLRVEASCLAEAYVITLYRAVPSPTALGI